MKQFIIALLFIPIISVSQNNDYIITKDNDTLYGRIKALSHTFVPNSGEKKIKKNPDETIGYYIQFSDEFYESVISPYSLNNGKKIFMLKIISGKISLYSKESGKYLLNYYTSKNGSIPKYSFDSNALGNKKRHKEIRKLIEDNSELTKEFDSMKGNLKNIKSILKKYNNS